jgi:hypothetical protein
MVDTAVLLGADRDFATSELKESLLFEISLVSISHNSISAGKLSDKFFRHHSEKSYPIKTNLTVKMETLPGDSPIRLFADLRTI